MTQFGTLDLDLDQAAMAAADPTGQAGDVLALGEHLRDALWRVESAGIAPAPAAGVVVAGMGGSAIGGRLAAAVLAPELRAPLLSAQGYELPAFVGRDWLVVCSSYSGGTEETLSAYAAAGALGARRIAVTSGGELAERARADRVPVIPLPGGFQPRAAVGYSLVAALEAAALGGAAPSSRGAVERAAAIVGELAEAWGPAGDEDGEAKALARALHGTVPVVYGAGLTAALAYRWKCQLNENAKVPSFSAELPEADHNEIVGWPASGSLGRFSAVFLEDPELHPRVAARVGLTAGVAERAGASVARARSRGEHRLERLASLVLLGDLVSLYLAVLREEDPVEILPIDELKAALAAL